MSRKSGAGPLGRRIAITPLLAVGNTSYPFLYLQWNTCIVIIQPVCSFLGLHFSAVLYEEVMTRQPQNRVSKFLWLFFQLKKWSNFVHIFVFGISQTTWKDYRAIHHYIVTLVWLLCKRSCPFFAFSNNSSKSMSISAHLRYKKLPTLFSLVAERWCFNGTTDKKGPVNTYNFIYKNIPLPALLFFTKTVT